MNTLEMHDFWTMLLQAGASGATLAGLLWAFRAACGSLAAHRERIHQMTMQRDIQVASHQHPLPMQTLHYAPSWHDSRKWTPSTLPELAAAADDHAAPDTVPSFSDLVQSGAIAPGAKLIIGHTPDGKALATQWSNLYSSAIGGLSGSGKSWTAVSLLCQSLLQGATVAVIDPDATDPNSLAGRLTPLHTRFITDPAHDDAAIQHLIALLTAELEARSKGERSRTPLVVAIDEYNDIARHMPELATLVDMIGRRGRRQAMFCLAMSHQWQGVRVGGADVRDVFASAFIHRLRPAQARMLTGLTTNELPGDVLQLPEGHAYLLSTRGELRRVIIPQMTEHDVTTVAGMLTDNAATMPRVDSHSTVNNQSSVSHTMTPDYSAPQSGIAYTAEDARIVSLFLSGMDASGIVKEVYGLHSKQGRPYMAKLADVQQVLRAHLQARVVGGE